jgi:hypothetical protein
MKNVGISVVYNSESMLMDYRFVVNEVLYPVSRSLFNDIVFGLDNKTIQDIEGFISLIRELQ